MNTDNRNEHAAGIVTFRRDEGLIRFLLLRNAKHGTWGVPKGHRESGESEIENALRETREETGIEDPIIVGGFREVIEYPVASTPGPAQKEVVYFLGEVASDVIHMSAEHDACEWVTIEKAVQLIRHENLQLVLRLAHRAAELL